MFVIAGSVTRVFGFHHFGDNTLDSISSCCTLRFAKAYGKGSTDHKDKTCLAQNPNACNVERSTLSSQDIAAQNVEEPWIL